MKIVIVGGVAGGATAAARLRRLSEKAEILVLEKGPYISYANCGLPYYIGGDIQDRDKLLVQTPEGFAKRYGIGVRTNHEVLAVDTAQRLLRVYNHADGSESEIRYDRLLLSPGAKPVVPTLEGVEHERVFTLRTLPDTDRIKHFVDTHNPRRAVVVGGGFIGLEMAENLAHRGIAVTLIERSAHILPPFDGEMAAIVEQYLAEQGVAVHTGCAVSGFVPGGEGLVVQHTGGESVADMVLLSVGVQPDTAFLRGAGVELGPRGHIRVDDELRTSAAGVYAVGDAVEANHIVSGRPAAVPLAGPANRQGRLVAENLLGGHAKYTGVQGSAIAKVFGLTVAATGLNETAASAAGLSPDKVYITASSHAGYYPGAASMSIKLLFQRPSGRVLGAQIAGFDGVDKRCDVLATAICAGLTVGQLTELELCYAPPYSSAKDPVNVAGYVATNVLAGTVKQYFWQDFERLPRDGSVTLLDVRTRAEVALGAVPGAVHIPLDQLRDRLSELNAAKPVYVSCQSGQRSYLACRILTENGFDAYNFAGGYNMYQTLVKRG